MFKIVGLVSSMPSIIALSFVVVDRHVTYCMQCNYVVVIKSSLELVGTLMVLWHGQC